MDSSFNDDFVYPNLTTCQVKLMGSAATSRPPVRLPRDIRESAGAPPQECGIGNNNGRSSSNSNGNRCNFDDFSLGEWVVFVFVHSCSWIHGFMQHLDRSAWMVIYIVMDAMWFGHSEFLIMICIKPWHCYYDVFYRSLFTYRTSSPNSVLATSVLTCVGAIEMILKRQKHKRPNEPIHDQIKRPLLINHCWKTKHKRLQCHVTILW